ncbi:MAG: Holliday junction branch migration protein RuvA [Chloroflexi bacterium]|nr:Holliday junction branch migration protein RuvA [Chloroflexota bacterium]
MVSSLVSSVRGILQAMGPDWADVEIGGITLRVSVPGSTFQRISGIGQEVRLLTSLQVREDSLTLYGFVTEEERSAFEALIGISGVGPKLALSVLSRLSPESLASAVQASDTTMLSTVQGVGKKTAGRIVLELKGKLQGDWSVASSNPEDDEVLDALTSLGYSGQEARRAVAAIPDGSSLSVEEKVRRVLEQMGAD